MEGMEIKKSNPLGLLFMCDSKLLSCQYAHFNQMAPQVNPAPEFRDLTPKLKEFI